MFFTLCVTFRGPKSSNWRKDLQLDSIFFLTVIINEKKGNMKSLKL